MALIPMETLAGVCSAMLVASSSARATEPVLSNTDRAQRLSEEGLALYEKGLYRAAAKRFENAYRVLGDPRLLYNIGRSYEAAGDLLQAMQLYFRLVDNPTATGRLRQKALKRMRIVERLSLKSTPETQPTKPLRSTPAPVERTVAPQPKEPSEADWISVSTWVSAAVGIVGLVGGATFWIMGHADERALNEARATRDQVPSLTRRQALELACQAEKKKTTGGLLLGTGLVLTATAAILSTLDHRLRPRPASPPGSARWMQPAAAIAIAPLSGGGGVLLVGSRF